VPGSKPEFIKHFWRRGRRGEGAAMAAFDLASFCNFIPGHVLLPPRRNPHISLKNTRFWHKPVSHRPKFYLQFGFVLQELF